jgi:hypothetical protein
MKFADALVALRKENHPERCKVISDIVNMTLYPSPDGSIQGCSIEQDWLDAEDWYVISEKPHQLTLTEALHLLHSSFSEIVTTLDGQEYYLTPNLILRNASDNSKRSVELSRLLKAELFRI